MQEINYFVNLGRNVMSAYTSMAQWHERNLPRKVPQNFFIAFINQCPSAESPTFATYCGC